MKASTLCFLSSAPLLARAAVVSLVQFVDPTEITSGVSLTSTDGVAVPLGTNGAETTYLIAGPDTTTITTTESGATRTTTQVTTESFTVVASASGFKATNLGGLVSGLNVECHYTAAQAGECLYFVTDGTSGATTVTVTGTPDVLAVPISDKSGGASPTSNATGGDASSGGQNNGKNSATGFSAAGKLVAVLGGLVMGALATL
ncbi:hypothetical protein V5O48_005848 [Marasmius crinis-equi]|uniref:Uncharacterized protein n=1 Tax=Marasmius crinis-equi TaxID=585013 RepID=A0ABR3FL83_9AGAR